MTDSTLRTRLQRGELGIRLEFPSDWRVLHDTPSVLSIENDQDAVRWTALMHPLALDLAPDNESTLQEDLDRTARAIVRSTEADMRRRNIMAPDAESALVNPRFSPLVDYRVVQIDGHAALRAVHRTYRQRGLEFVMGHLTIPVRQGVLELRTIAFDSETGYRESALMMREHHRNPNVPPAQRTMPPQSEFDNPAHDAAFPMHSLSRVRAALDWVSEPGRIHVVEGAESIGPLATARPDAEFVLPPRFVRAPTTWASWTRMNFANTDGVWYLTLEYIEGTFGSSDEAVQKIRAYVDTNFREPGTPSDQVWIDVGGLPLYRLGYEENERNKAIATGWSRQRDHLVGISLVGPSGVKRGELYSMLAPLVESWAPSLKGAASNPS